MKTGNEFLKAVGEAVGAVVFFACVVAFCLGCIYASGYHWE